jgi:two-component system, NarL family, sensor histidine kinase UhpB
MRGPFSSSPATGSVSRLSAGGDAIVVMAVTVLAFLAASQFDLQEQIAGLTRPLEQFQADELLPTLLTLAVALVWFAWRRWHQATRELDRRLAAERELAGALAENRLLSQKYLAAQEDERRSLARELHDELGQCLNAIKLDATSIRAHPSAPPHEVVERAQAIIDVSSRVYDVTRGLMERLRPVALDELGLADALRHLVSEWGRRNSGIACSLEIRGELDGLGEELNISLYRIVQECLTNVTRHARASTVGVRVEGTAPAAGELRVSVRDDGVGMPTGAGKRTGLGLVGLRERVEALGGRLEVGARAPQGVEVLARIPLTAGRRT